MKTLVLGILIVLSMAPSAQAQTESFDIATFTTPPGWKRTVANGVVVLEDRRTRNGKPAFCQIYLFPSRAAGTNVAENFETEWNAKVAGPLGVSRRPQTETQMTPDGWTVVTGFADVSRQGLVFRAGLIVATGFGRVMSFAINMSDVTYEGDIDTFFEKLDLHANAVEKPGPGTARPAPLPTSIRFFPTAGMPAPQRPKHVRESPAPRSYRPRKPSLETELIRSRETV